MSDERRPPALDELNRALFGADTPEAPAAGRRAPSTSPSTRLWERRLVLAVTLVSAASAVGAPGEPSGWEGSDAVLRAAMAGVLALAASRSRRWTWVWCPGLALVASESAVGAATSGVALTVGVGAMLWDRRRRWVGALVGGLAAQALLRLPDAGFSGSSAVVAMLASGPVVVSAFRVAPRRVRRRIRAALGLAAAVTSVGVVVLAVSASVARSRVERAIEEAQGGLEAAQEGEADVAAARLSAAADDFEWANGILGAWWTAPARVLPVAGRQAMALDVATDQGEQLARSAASAAASVDTRRFTWENGRLDLALVEQAQRPLRDAADSLDVARAELAAAESPWLVPPIAERLERLRSEVADAYPDAVLAADLAEVGPAILGREHPRRYFVVFTTPAESRGIGGFMGNWAELVADDGKLTLARHGRTAELNEAAPPGERQVRVDPGGTTDPALADFVRRYDVYKPQDTLQDVTLSPDFPTVAKVFEQLYPQSGGEQIDGVLLVDPYALAELMRFTGPIKVEGLEEPLTHENAARFLLVDQYEQFPDRATRADFLDDVTRITFEELTTSDLPDPHELAETLAPMVGQGRLLLHSANPREQEIYERVGLDGAMPQPGPVDFLSVVTQNGANNKIDAYLQRAISYEAEVDPGSGSVEATARVLLTNALPSLDLPEPVIGSNDRDLPPGTNVVFFNLYTPWRLVSATLDGEPLALEADTELGRRVYSGRFSVAMGAAREVEVRLVGEVAPFERYELVWANQPLVNDDEVSVDVRLVGPGRWGGSGVLEVADDGVARVAGPFREDSWLWVERTGD